jgi:3-phenylpropionate/trans-cinnamate dioxygenase ferredoxin reductase component
MNAVDAPIVIVGAGQGGLQLAESLRKEKYQGDILLIGDEAHAPYTRPPLSKALLLGEMTVEQLELRNPNALNKKRIELCPNTRVTAINRATRELRFLDGGVQSYSKLALATGSRARDLPIDGIHLEGVHCLRTLDDVLAIQKQLGSVRHLTVIGGGFIGLEMAAVARKLGKDVTVLEVGERLMARVVAPPVSDYFLQLHRQKGVDVRLNSRAGALKGKEGQVSGVILQDGEVLDTDLVVLGVGIIPNAELAEEAGLVCDNGIVVDHCGQTSDPDIVACGDCTATLTDSGLRRLESVQNAVEQAKAAAAALMGLNKPFSAAPWFWSDQYHIKLQMVGVSAGYEDLVLRGSIEDEAFSFCYFKDGRLIAIDSVNAPSDHMLGRKLVGNPLVSISPEQAADKAYDLARALDTPLA